VILDAALGFHWRVLMSPSVFLAQTHAAADRRALSLMAGQGEREEREGLRAPSRLFKQGCRRPSAAEDLFIPWAGIALYLLKRFFSRHS